MNNDPYFFIAKVRLQLYQFCEINDEATVLKLSKILKKKHLPFEQEANFYCEGTNDPKSNIHLAVLPKLSYTAKINVVRLFLKYKHLGLVGFHSLTWPRCLSSPFFYQVVRIRSSDCRACFSFIHRNNCHADFKKSNCSVSVGLLTDRSGKVCMFA